MKEAPVLAIGVEKSVRRISQDGCLLDQREVANQRQGFHLPTSCVDDTDDEKYESSKVSDGGDEPTNLRNDSQDTAHEYKQEQNKPLVGVIACLSRLFCSQERDQKQNSEIGQNGHHFVALHIVRIGRNIYFFHTLSIF